jgi:carboxylesterase type B
MPRSRQAYLAPLCFASACLAQNSSYIADLGYVKYEGTLNNSAIQYFGIPYAAPPLGELRWRAPLDIESHGGFSPDEVISASERGPICVQGAPYWRNNPALNSTGSEDCLLLDILTPQSPVNESLPVLVQMYVSMTAGWEHGC